MPVVFVSNHKSWLDIYSLFWLDIPLKFVAKREIFYIPVAGWAMALIGHVALDRDVSDKGAVVLAKCRQRLQQGASVFFFAEGRRTRDGKLNAFKVRVSIPRPLLEIVLVPSTSPALRAH